VDVGHLLRDAAAVDFPDLAARGAVVGGEIELALELGETGGM